MVVLLVILSLIILLYTRSLNYNWMPDDAVPRDRYLYDVPDIFPSYNFLRQKPHKRVRIWCIANHCINTSFIYVLFGWKASLIFAVHPVAVEMTCWITGNYYAGTTTLILAAYLCIQQFGIYGVIPAIIFYMAALYSTITALGFPIFYLMTGNAIGLSMFIPFIQYFCSSRFKKGMKIRKESKSRDFDKLEFKKLFFMTKIVGEYIKIFFLPLKMGLFRPFGEDVIREKKFYDRDCRLDMVFWISLAICLTVFIIGVHVNLLATMWFFTMIAPHSQFKVYGQSSPCDRYLYLPMIGLCILVSYLPNPIFFTLIGVYIYKTYSYIPAWKNLESLYKHQTVEFPNRTLSHADYSQYLITEYTSQNSPIIDANRINEALYHTNIALKQSKDNPDFERYEIYSNSVCVMLAIQNIDDAIKFTRKAIDIGKNQVNSTYLIKIFEEQELDLINLKREGR